MLPWMWSTIVGKLSRTQKKLKVLRVLNLASTPFPWVGLICLDDYQDGKDELKNLIFFIVFTAWPTKKDGDEEDADKRKTLMTSSAFWEEQQRILYYTWSSQQEQPLLIEQKKAWSHPSRVQTSELSVRQSNYHCLQCSIKLLWCVDQTAVWDWAYSFHWGVGKSIGAGGAGKAF